MRRRFVPIAYAAVWFCLCPERGLGATNPPAPPYVEYHQPVIAIAHVRVIDGTGARHFTTKPCSF